MFCYKIINLFTFCLLGTFPVTFSASELGAGVHNYTVVGMSNGVTITQSIIITSECMYYSVQK